MVSHWNQTSLRCYGSFLHNVASTVLYKLLTVRLNPYFFLFYSLFLHQMIDIFFICPKLWVFMINDWFNIKLKIAFNATKAFLHNTGNIWSRKAGDNLIFLCIPNCFLFLTHSYWIQRGGNIGLSCSIYTRFDQKVSRLLLW